MSNHRAPNTLETGNFRWEGDYTGFSDVPFPSLQLQRLCRIHEQHDITVRGTVGQTHGIDYEVLSDGGGIVLKFEANRSFDYAIELLLEIPNIYIRAIELDAIDVPEPVNYLIATLAPSIGYDEMIERLQLANEELGLPASNFLLSPPPEALNLHSIWRLSVDAVVLDSSTMNLLLSSAQKALPNLKTFIYDGQYNHYEGEDEVEEDGFRRLHLLADRLQDLQIRYSSFAIKAVAQFLQKTSILKTLSLTTFEDTPIAIAATNDLSKALVQNKTVKSLKLDCNFGFEGTEVILDVFRSRQNKILEEFEGKDEQTIQDSHGNNDFTLEMRHWCNMNRIEKMLSDDVSKRDLIQKGVVPHMEDVSNLFSLLKDRQISVKLDESCPICLENYVDHGIRVRTLVILKCGHNLCAECMCSIKSSNSSPSCAICREPM